MTFLTFLPWLIALALAGAAAFLFVQQKQREQQMQNDEGVKQQFTLLAQQFQQFESTVRDKLAGSSESMTQFLQTQSGHIQQSNHSMGSKLDVVGKTVGDRLDNAARVVSELERRMMKLEEATKRVSEVGKDIASLQEILRSPKLRGNLGEHFLHDLLAQMLPQESYEMQFGFSNGERVDAIIKTAHGIVPIDAKFPLENFKKLLSATEESQQKLLRKQFATDVKKHIDDISKKYIRPGEGTFDFALMYIPAENVYYEIIAKDHETNESKPLVAYAMEKHVIAVSPNTFYAYLNTILLGLKGMRVERFAKDILKDMERIRTEVNRFTAEFTTIGTHIAHANSAYTKAEKRIGRIDERLSSFSSSHQGVESFPAAETLPLQP